MIWILFPPLVYRDWVPGLWSTCFGFCLAGIIISTAIICCIFQQLGLPGDTAPQCSSRCTYGKIMNVQTYNLTQSKSCSGAARQQGGGGGESLHRGSSVHQVMDKIQHFLSYPFFYSSFKACFGCKFLSMQLINISISNIQMIPGLYCKNLRSERERQSLNTCRTVAESKAISCNSAIIWFKSV